MFDLSYFYEFYVYSLNEHLSMSIYHWYFLNGEGYGISLAALELEM